MGCVYTHTHTATPTSKHSWGAQPPPHPPPLRDCFWLESQNYGRLIFSNFGEPQNPPYSYCPGLEQWYEVENEVRIVRMPQGLTKQSQWYDQRCAYSWPSKDIFSKPLRMPRLIEHWGIQRPYSDIRPLHITEVFRPDRVQENASTLTCFCLICSKVEQALTGTSVNDEREWARLSQFRITVTKRGKCGPAGCPLVRTFSGLPLTCVTFAAPSGAISHHKMGLTSPEAAHCLQRKASEICLCDSLRDLSIKLHFSALLHEPWRCLLHLFVCSHIEQLT